MTSKTYKWGIIGPGKIAGKFSEDLARVSGAQLYAVASRDAERAKDFSEKYKFSKSYGSYEEMAQDEEVDIIYIATPHVFHCENTLLCLKHKKAVLCEKPFAMNAAEVEKMIAAANEHKAFLMEGMWTVFLPHYQYLLELIKSRELGKLLNLKADFGFAAPFLPEKRLYNKSLGGGSLLDVGIYPVFAALSLMGVPENIEASAQMGETGVDESCTIDFQYNTGAVAMLNCAINDSTPTTATLIFEKAKVTVNSRFHEPTSILIEQEGEEREINFEVHTRGYNYEAAHVQQMLDENRVESNVMSFQKSKELIKLLDLVRTRIGLEY